MRLIDEVVLRLARRRQEDAIRLIESAPKFFVDNVFDYHQRIINERHAEDFPCVRPPFDDMWIEWKAPPSAGVSYERAALHITKSPSQEKLIAAYLGAALGCIAYTLTLTTNTGGIRGGLMIITADGRFVSAYEIPNENLPASAVGIDYRLRGTTSAHILSVALQTLAFLNCKNVDAVNEQRDEPLAMKFHRKNGRRPLQYKTLKIIPLQRWARGNQQPAGSGDVALHIRRGHFKDYREHGLFGKAKGIFWWDQAFAGTADRYVDKEYEVTAPHPDDESPKEGN